MKILGVIHSGYNTVRNISSLPFKEFKVEKKYDFFKFPDYIIFKLALRTIDLIFNLHQDFGLNKCDIFHFYNTVSFGKTPWVTTFETKVPRFGKAPRMFVTMGIKLVAGKHCKKLIAMSECAKNIELHILKTDYPKYYDAIEKKMTVIYPSQKLLVTDYSQKKLNDILSFIIVGSEFFLKGGMEILLAVDKLLGQNKNIRLYIVSRLEIKKFATEEDRNAALAIIKKHPEHIIYYPSLPNKEVLELFSKCHVAMLTTYADTFGYSVLEAQASGCPVITTNIRALGEINDDSRGWVIKVPRDEIGFAIINTPEEKREFSAILLKGLVDVISDIIENPAQVAVKGAACLTYIKEKHNPEKTARQLEEIYNAAIADKN